MQCHFGCHLVIWTISLSKCRPRISNKAFCLENWNLNLQLASWAPRYVASRAVWGFPASRQETLGGSLCYSSFTANFNLSLIHPINLYEWIDPTISPPLLFHNLWLPPSGFSYYTLQNSTKRFLNFNSQPFEEFTSCSPKSLFWDRPAPFYLNFQICRSWLLAAAPWRRAPCSLAPSTWSPPSWAPSSQPGVWPIQGWVHSFRDIPWLEV